MDEKTDILQINIAELIALKDEAGRLTTTPQAEEQLAKVVQFKKLADSIMEYVKSKLQETMQKESYRKIEGEKFTIIEKVTGEEFEITDDAKDQFVKQISFTKPDADEIRKYQKEHGQLPQGVLLKARAKRIQIYEKER